MATYVPNATDLTQPTTDKFVESAAAEFRAIKTLTKNIDDRLGYIETTGGGGGGSSSKAQIIGLLTNKDAVDVASYNTDPNQAIFKFDCTSAWSGADFKDSMMILRNADYSGYGVDGSGITNSGYGLFVQTTSSANAGNNECGIRGIVVSNAVINPANTALGQAWPQQVAIGGNAFQMAASNAPVWGGWFTAHNLSGADQVAGRGALCGIEVNVGMHGTDSYSSTLGVMCIPLVVGSGVVARPWTAFWAAGERNPSSPNNIGWQYGFMASSGIYSSFYSNATQSQRCFEGVGQYLVGLDLSQATINGAAIRIKRGNVIAFDGNDQYFMRLHPGTGLIEFFNNTTRRGYINLDAGVDADLASGSGGDAYVAGINTFTNVNHFENSVFLGTYSSGIVIPGTTIYQGYTLMAGNFDMNTKMFVISNGTTALGDSNVTVATRTFSGAYYRVLLNGSIPRYIPLYQ